MSILTRNCKLNTEATITINTGIKGHLVEIVYFNILITITEPVKTNENELENLIRFLDFNQFWDSIVAHQHQKSLSSLFSEFIQIIPADLLFQEIVMKRGNEIIASRKNNISTMKISSFNPALDVMTSYWATGNWLWVASSVDQAYTLEKLGEVYKKTSYTDTVDGAFPEQFVTLAKDDVDEIKRQFKELNMLISFNSVKD